MAERQKLTILGVKDVVKVKVGGKELEKLTFQARNQEGKDFWYSTLRTSLFDAIRNNKEIEADVKETETEYGTNRNVSEVYVDGKAMGAVKGQGTRQWGGKSPEEIASIEAQSRAKIEAEAAKLVMEGWIAGKLTDDSPLVVGMSHWAWHLLGPGLKEGAKPLDKPLDKGVEGSEDSGKTLWQRFLAECLRYGWGPKSVNEIGAWLKEHFGMRWIELSAEAKERAIEQMRQMADLKEDTIEV